MASQDAVFVLGASGPELSLNFHVHRWKIFPLPGTPQPVVANTAFGSLHLILFSPVEHGVKWCSPLHKHCFV